MNNTRRGLWIFLVGIMLAAAIIGLWRDRFHLDADSNAVLSLDISIDCDSAETACVARGPDIAVELSLGPSVQPMQPFPIRLRVVHGQLSANAQVELQFRMQDMDMGQNRYRLVADEQGVWQGTAVLPVCTRGRSDWLVQLAIEDGGRRWSAVLPFSAVAP